MKQNKGFGLFGIIVIMIVTAVISGIATGVIMLNNSGTNKSGLANDKELQDFISVYETLLSRYYNDIDKEAMLKAAEEGMLNFLGDKYTTYLEDDEYGDILDELAATYNGIGVEIQGNLIVAVTPSSPAEKEGLLSGDVITKINGIDVTRMDSTGIGALIKNDSSKSVDIEINRNNEIMNFKITKTNLINKSVNYQIIENTHIGYLAITKFSENLSDQVSSALKDLEKNGINSLIVDVRDNVGGYLAAAESTSELFLAENKVIYSLQTSSNEVPCKDSTKEKRDYPIVVLINENSASAAEILAAALDESYNATLVGIKSYGKGKVQQVEPLENGGSLKLTTAKWLTPSGTCIDGVGIAPDYVISNDVENGIDNQLNKAIELLNGF